jgi:hypothetical protein
MIVDWSPAHGETAPDTHTDRQTAYPAGKLPYRPPCSGPKPTPAQELKMNTTRTPGGRPGGVQISTTL